MTPPQQPATIEAIDRALALLETLAAAPAAGMSLAEVAGATGVNRSTAYRALNTLRARGYVAQSPTTSYYSLGPGVAALHQQWMSQNHLTWQLHPALAAVSQHTQELAHLGILTGTEVVYVDKVEPQRALRVWSRIGGTVPAATSAMGRAILAASDITQPQLAPFVESTLDADSDRIWREIELARTRGYAREAEENEPGISCVGFALLRADSVVAALSITAPAERMTDALVTQLVRDVRTVAPPLLPQGITLSMPTP